MSVYHNEIFDTKGDLRLIVAYDDDERYVCLVCSKTLARASPVFGAMLLGEFDEAKSRTDDGNWEVELPEDDAVAMWFILNIIHGHVDQIPRKLENSSRDVTGDKYLSVEICKAADKYGVIRLLKPWAKGWLDEERQKEKWTCHWMSECLWISWLLGDEDFLNKQLDQVVFSAYIDESLDVEGDEALRCLCSWGGDRDPSYDEIQVQDGYAGILGILGIKDQLPDLRRRVLQALLSPIRSFLFKPLTYIDPGCGWHMQLDGPGTDRQVVMKAFEKALLSQGLFPLPGPQTYKGSPKDLQKSLDRVEMRFERAAKSFSLLCSDCKPLKRVMESVRGAIGSRHLIRLTKAQREHLARRREESGIGDGN